MGLKAWIAARFDARYARRHELATINKRTEHLSNALAALGQSISASSGEAQWDGLARTAKELDELKRATLEMRRELKEAYRLAREGALAIEGLLEEQLKHGQSIDALSGDGR